MRILIVDDEPEVLRAIGKMLAKEGHELVGVTSALEAVQRLADEHFDLGLIDFELGTSLTGLDVGKHARMRDPSMSLIIVSGYAPDEMRPKLEDPLQPFLACIGKPLHRATLIEHVRQAARRAAETKP